MTRRWIAVLLSLSPLLIAGCQPAEVSDAEAKPDEDAAEAPPERVRPVPHADYDFAGKWGKYGREEGCFKKPIRLTAGGGFVYVADAGTGKVLKFQSDGTYVGAWRTGDPNAPPEQTGSPLDLALDARGNVYVLEGSLNQVQCFAPDGTLQRSYGGTARGPDRLHSPTSLSVGADGHVFVLETSRNQVMKFGSNGSFMAEFGKRGGYTGQTREPQDLAVDVDGRVVVTDSGNSRMQRLGGAGEFVKEWGRGVKGPGGFETPDRIALDPRGNSFITDPDRFTLQRFTRTGELVCSIGAKGRDDGQFEALTDVATDASGTVYVLDAGQGCVTLFRERPNAAPGPASGAGDVQSGQG